MKWAPQIDNHSDGSLMMSIVCQGLEATIPYEPAGQGPYSEVRTLISVFINLLRKPPSVDMENEKVELTLRSEDPRERENQVKRLPSDLHEGEKVDGTIKRIEEYGIFIQIEGSKFTGLCHKSEASGSINHSQRPTQFDVAFG